MSSWLHIGKNSIGAKEKERKFIQGGNTLHGLSVSHLERQARYRGMGLSVFVGVSNFIG